MQEPRKKTKLNTEAACFQPFHEFYKQLLNWQEEDFQTFTETLNKELPITFRLDENLAYFQKLQSDIAQNYPELNQRLPGIYELNLSKLDLRKQPHLKKYKIFLEEHSILNHIHRQELVSMFPVLLLKLNQKIQKNNETIQTDNSDLWVLDMCAAPGSKTLQAIQQLQKNSQNSFFLINEIDKKRCSMLATQTIKSFYPNTLVISEDARKIQNHSFDKIICDVPCAGDGTIRKNTVILKNWTQKYAQNLHNLQIGILLNGLHLLNINGDLCYSTCSMNPIENEAVVQFVLDLLGDSIELQEITIDGITMRNGMTDWKIWVKQGKTSGYYNEHHQHMPAVYQESFFPTKSQPSLIKTKRIFPHDNNTGGFYLALFKKKQPFNREIIEPYLEDANEQNEPIEKIEQIEQVAENKEEFLPSTQIQLKSLQNAECKENFLSSLDFHQLSNLNLKHLYLSFAKNLPESTSKRMHYFPMSNLLEKFQSYDIIQAGIQIFKQDRSKNEVNLRLTYEGANLFKHLIGAQKRVANKEIFLEILNNCPLKIEGDIQWGNFQQGTVVIEEEKSKEVFTVWKGIGQVTLSISKEEQTQINYKLSQ